MTYSFAFAVIAAACIIGLGEASHFRGSYIYWRPASNDTTNSSLTFTFRSAWRLGAGPCNSLCTGPDPQAALNQLGLSGLMPWQCADGCLPTRTVHDANYYMSIVDPVENYEQGENTFTFLPQAGDNDTVKLVASGCCWISNILNLAGGRMRVEATIRRGRRSDTGTQNSSPRVGVFPIEEVPFNSVGEISLNPSDEDGDRVRCRWATPAEASAPSGVVPGAVLDQTTCKITMNTTTAHGFVQDGWYAFALQVEDFPKSTINMGKSSFTSKDALSSVPVQFLVHLTNVDSNKVPVVVNSSNANAVVTVGENFTRTLCARAADNKTIVSWTVSGPLGMVQGSLTPEGPARLAMKCGELTWNVPKTATPGDNLVCFYFTDGVRRKSKRACFTLQVKAKSECEKSPCEQGVCEDLKAGFLCRCHPGFSGTLCAERLTTTKPTLQTTLKPATTTFSLKAYMTAACSAKNIAAGRFYHPYPFDAHRFIQCDEWGQAFVMPCVVSTKWDQATLTCVEV